MALNFQQSGSASAKRVLLVVLLVISLALATLYAREGEDGPLHAVPVSYTHLDVYKRQASGSMPSACWDPCM